MCAQSKLLSFKKKICLPTCIHEGHGEVDRLLPDGGNGEVDDGHVGLLRPQLGNHPVPLAVLVGAIGPVRLQLELVLELDHLRQLLEDVCVYLYLTVCQQN